MGLQAKPYLQTARIRPEDDIDFSVFPYSVPAIKDLGLLEFHADVTFLVGENGSGKSTLLEALAVAMGLGPEGGNKNYRFKTADTISDLHQHLLLSKSFKRPKDFYFLRAESFFNLATYVDEVGYLEGYGGKSLHVQSHGESFMALLLNKLRGGGLYLMDEPEAALSPNRQLAALSAIHQLVEDGSQFIIATHSPILLAYPRAKIYQLDSSGIYETSYEDTEHYATTKDFLNNYQRRLDYLLQEED